MAITVLTQTPDQVRYFPAEDDPAARMTEKHVDDLIEIFKTPLSGAYNWDYDSADGRIRHHQRLGSFDLSQRTAVDFAYIAGIFPSFREYLGDDIGVTPRARTSVLCQRVHPAIPIESSGTGNANGP